MPTSNLPEIRHTRSGSLGMAPQSGGIPNAGMIAVGRFDGPRSPPNTSHVPCKFFRQGACQAGNACPFSHDLGHAAETVCKYFAKGNCKFGPKCANIHVLPDGRRVNYGKNGVTIGGVPQQQPPIAIGNRVDPARYIGHGHFPTNTSALTNSFMRGGDSGAFYPIPADERYLPHRLGRQPSLENNNGGGLPIIDTTYSSNPASAYGSPRDNDDTALPSRFGLGLSPVANGLSVLDAPLPASFDSNGISHAARYGPWPASVPSKFGLESPSHSLNAAKDARTSETLKMLHDSAFGSSEVMSQQGFARGGNGEINSNGASGLSMASSPPVNSPWTSGRFPAASGGGAGGEEYFGRRTMHSSSSRFAKPRMLSSSAPQDWEPEFMFEEDYVPGTLANEVLTPAEKARRGSNTATLRGLPDDNGNEGSSSGMSSIGAVGIAGSASTTKFGSPSAIGTGSPGRWGQSVFQRHKSAEDELASGLDSSYFGGGVSSGSFGGGRSMKHAASAFGHVGSPLRNSSLASAMGTERLSGSPSSRPAPGSRSASGTESLSALTQQLRQTSLDSDAAAATSPSPHLHPKAAAALSALGSLRDRERALGERSLERHVSSGSIGSSNRFTTPIDEEEASFVFRMEEEEEMATARARKRQSGGAGMASPLGNNGWSYASAAAAARNGNGGGGGGGGVGSAGVARGGSGNGSGSVGTVGGR